MGTLRPDPTNTTPVAGIVGAKLFGCLSWLPMRKRETVPTFDPDRLTALRTDQQLTVGALAERCGLYRQNLNTIETGRRPAAFDTVIELAQALNVDPTELTTLDPDQLPLSGIRLQRHISRVELAEKTDVSYHLWWQIETGRRNLTDALAERAAVVLDVDVDDLRQALGREVAGQETRS